MDKEFEKQIYKMASTLQFIKRKIDELNEYTNGELDNILGAITTHYEAQADIGDDSQFYYDD